MDLHIGDVHVPDERVGHRSPSPASPPAPPTGAPLRRRDPTAGTWRNRITGHADVAPASLLPHPANWRRHPVRQQRALAGALGEVGWVAQVMVNRVTGHLVDGHLRLELALARGEPTSAHRNLVASVDEVWMRQYVAGLAQHRVCGVNIRTIVR